MKAIIMAGGKGTRLKPYTTVLPKPLVPVGNRAILEILIERLRLFSITDLTFCVNHLAELIMAFFGDGGKWGVNISYSMEDKPLSTVAPLKLVSDLPENFFVMNGDLLTDLDFRLLYQKHIQSDGMITVATYQRQAKIDFGVIEVNNENLQAVGFREKPTYDLDVSMGIYVFRRQVLDLVPDGVPFGFDNLMETLLERGEKINIHRHKGYWLDIGRPEDFEQANLDVGHHYFLREENK